MMSKELSAVLCHACNDWLMEYCSAEPKRLLGVGLIPCQDPQAAVKELEYLKKAGAVTAMLPTNVYGLNNMGDKMFDPIYLLTQGGPGEATTNISVYLFDETAQNTRWGYASSVAIIVLIFVSIVGFWAIRPIERAQEETLEELTGAEAVGAAPSQRVEEAIEAEARV